MKESKLLKVVLFISGLIGVVVGGAILVDPVSFYASNGIELGGNISLLNEVRAPGGALLGCGLLVMAGAFSSSLTFTSTVLATLVYLSYGLARVVSIIADGMPADILVQVTVLEVVVGLICAFALVKYRTAS
ncbi:hypothetical protein R50073_36430 [Maricurvus nonylphenolicus]|uniref:DUF4345 domain-containing protein n=1 Tax=Maricurvus nonylphenolicus TaxID=1008307 RepID=UPI0036F396E3